MRFSGFKIISEALSGHKGWDATWRDATPKSHYDYIIIGGGGHGLAGVVEHGLSPLSGFGHVAQHEPAPGNEKGHGGVEHRIVAQGRGQGTAEEGAKGAGKLRGGIGQGDAHGEFVAMAELQREVHGGGLEALEGGADADEYEHREQ